MADLKHLKRELQTEFEVLGIASSDVLWSEACLKEMGKCLQPDIHEGRIAPYGALIGRSYDMANHAKFIKLSVDQLKLGRSVADGVRTFTIFDVNGFQGLLLLRAPATDELTLVNLRETTDSTILTRDSEGTTRVFLQTGIAVHRHRRWSFRPAVDLIVQRLQKTCPCVEQPAFGAVLRFAFHQLSPFKTGATLVWCLEQPSEKDLEKMRPAIDLTRLRADVADEAVLPSIRHLLAQVDGATIIAPEGMFLGTGAQLQPSSKSKQVVSEHKGTRHTSARRFSFDFDRSIVVVVSGDGTVSIFSDGASIADLRTIPTRNASQLLRQNDERTPGSVHSFRQVCAGCGKLCVIETAKMSDDGPAHSIQCPVCNRILLSIAGSTAEVYVQKPTPLERQPNERRRA